MANTTALEALYTAVYSRLKNAGNAGLKVYPDIADDSAIPENTTGAWVFWVYFWAGGGESNQRRKDDAELVLGVKCVSNDLGVAFAGAQQISTLLNNQGIQDVVATTGAYVSNPLNGGTDWKITTSTKEESIHLTEIEGQTAETVYHDGAYYRFVMEET